jgi:hypothetical protein
MKDWPAELFPGVYQLNRDRQRAARVAHGGLPGDGPRAGARIGRDSLNRSRGSAPWRFPDALTEGRP